MCPPLVSSTQGDRCVGGGEVRARGRNIRAAKGEGAPGVRPGRPPTRLQNSLSGPAPRSAAADVPADAFCLRSGFDCERGHFLPAARLLVPPPPPPPRPGFTAHADTAGPSTTAARDDAGGSLF